jgi:hypothetical protein
MNSERAALRETPAFRNKMAVPRLSTFKDIIEKAAAMRKTHSPPLSPTGDGAISRSNSRMSVKLSPRGSKKLSESVPAGYVSLDAEQGPPTQFSFDKLELRLSSLSVKVDEESSSSDSIGLSKTYSDPRLAAGSKSARSDQPSRANTEFTFKQVKPTKSYGSKTARSMTVAENTSQSKSPRSSTEVSKERRAELTAVAAEPLVLDLTNVTDVTVLEDAIRKIQERKDKLRKALEGK